MKLLKLFLTATGIYAFFLIRGLPNNHYLDWSIDFQIGDCLEIMIFTVPLTYGVLKLFSSKADYFKDSGWFAFFLSVPFVFYDLIYLGIIRGHGLAYFKTFWFLTIFYFIVLVEVPLIGYVMKEDKPEIVKKHVIMLLSAIIAWLLNCWEGWFSDHYLQWSLNMKIARIINVTLLLTAIVSIILNIQSRKEDSFKDAVLVTIYFSFVFMIFDFFYLGVIKGTGVSYITEYWFVTAFYPIFWLEIPLIGLLLRGRENKTGEIR